MPPITRPGKTNSVTLMVVAQGLSGIGTRVSYVVLPFALLALGFGASEIALVLGFKVAAAGAGALFAGVLADRLAPLRIMRVADGVRCVSMAGTAAALAFGVKSLALLLLLQALAGIADACFSPAAHRLLVSLVAEDDLIRINARLSLLAQAAMLIGPVIGGAVAASLGAGVALMVDAMTFLFSLLLLGGIAGPEGAGSQDGPWSLARVIGDASSGFSGLLASPRIARMILASAVFHLTALAALYSLGPIYAERELGGAQPWGLLVSIFGMGGIAGALVMSRHKGAAPEWVPFLALAVISSQAAVVSSGMPFDAIAALQFCNGAFLSVFSVTYISFLQTHTKPEILGRISAFDDLATSTLMPIGYGLVGLAAVEAGLAETMLAMSVLSGGFCLLLGLFVVASRPRDGHRPTVEERKDAVGDAP